jgi:hypothetical protein
VLCRLSYAHRLEEPPAGVEPALQPYEGCVLPLTPQRPEVETAGVEPAFPRCKRGARPLSYVPDGQCERVESNHHSAGAAALQAAELSGAQRSHAARRRATDRIRTGTCRAHTPGCCRYTTVTTTRTTGLEPAASRWTAERSARLSYVPRCAGGIRTHGLELMRLARTASPLPRICPAGVEPAVSGSRNRRGGRLPHEQ